MNEVARLDKDLIGVDFAIEREEYDVARGGPGHIDVDPCPGAVGFARRRRSPRREAAGPARGAVRRRRPRRG